MKKELILSAGILMGMLSSCEKNETLNSPTAEGTRIEVPALEPQFMALPPLPDAVKQQQLSSKAGDLSYGVYMAEYITSGESDELGRTVFFNNRGNKQLAGDFAPGLAFLTDGTPDITYYVDNNRPSSDLAAAVTEEALDRAMDTWEGLTCSDLGMTKIPYDGSPTGFVSLIFGFGGSFDYTADVTHNGWLPGAFFDILAPGGSGFILGVTFTIVFLDENGDLIDTNNDGKFDVAWREIYYNDEFPWNDGSTFDVETVGLHEAGHGLSQGHFGSAFRTVVNGKIHFSPRAVMNAAYSGVQTSIVKTDAGGHCSIWSNWPNK